MFVSRISLYAFGCGGKFSVTNFLNTAPSSMFNPWFWANNVPNFSETLPSSFNSSMIIVPPRLWLLPLPLWV